MSGGIARGRLAEERRAWRKNHPHVRTPLFLSSFLYCSAFLFPLFSSSSLKKIYVFLGVLISYRVSSRSLRPLLMDPSIWWSGSAPSLASPVSVLFLFFFFFWLGALGFVCFFRKVTIFFSPRLFNWLSEISPNFIDSFFLTLYICVYISFSFMCNGQCPRRFQVQGWSTNCWDMV